MNSPIVDNAKVMTKGQITLPKDIRTKLQLNTGDRVTLICEDDMVILHQKVDQNFFLKQHLFLLGIKFFNVQSVEKLEFKGLISLF